MAKSTTKFSKESIYWLNFCQNQTPFKCDDAFHVIQHALNTGEKEIRSPSLRFFPDGWCCVDGLQHFFFYQGCFFHKCPHCQVWKNSKFVTEDKISRDRKIEEYCRKNGVYHVMYGCQWAKMKKSGIEFINYTSQFFDDKNIEEYQLLKAIENESLYGFVQADITSPPNVIERFKAINFPPIFSHVYVSDDMINPVILKNLKEKKKDYSKEKQLSLTFNAKSYLMTTDLCKWYMDQGLEISNITLVVEYIKYQPFKKFISQLVDCRKTADENGQSDLATLYKLKANSTYGSLALDRTKVIY